MNAKERYTLLSVLLYLLIIAPIWFYLMYKILKLVGASELMMFLFWVYVPVSILASIISKIAAGD